MRRRVVNRVRYFAVLPVALFCFCVVATSPAGAQDRLVDSMQVDDTTDTMVVDSPPPPIPEYLQPPVMSPDYMWIPGYWAWGSAGYFWVPGAWVLPPEPGLLWTPGYWGSFSPGYVWHRGYWGRRVGFYGGINYGFGYFGTGYVGGGWYGSHFRYNTFVTNVNTRVVRNVYVDRTVVVNNNRVSYNGGRGGIVVGPSSHQLAMRERRPMTMVQMRHEGVAAQDRNQLASISHNRPRQPSVNRPFTPQNRPPGFDHVRPEDRAATHARATRVPRQPNSDRGVK